jgi:hypothetical protein
MKTIELTEEELEAFKVIFINEQLGDYLSYSESGKLCKDSYSSLFTKLGISLVVETTIDFGEEDVSN